MSAGERRMDEVSVQVRLFGPFRRYGNGAELSFRVPRGTTVAALRGHLAEALRRASGAFDGEGLLERSVLADEHRILTEDLPLGVDADRIALAVLPPVCGG